MKFNLLCIALVLLLTGSKLSAASNSHQVTFSLTLSGHLLLGLGYTYSIDNHNELQTTFFLAPEKGLPCALNGGYNYFWSTNKWQPNLGFDLTLLASPPGPDKRKYLPLINIVPGIRYNFDDNNKLNLRLWLSYFPIKANVKFAPTGIEFKYNRCLLNN